MEKLTHDLAPETVPTTAIEPGVVAGVDKKGHPDVVTPDGRHHKQGYKPVAPVWQQFKDSWGGLIGTVRHNAINATPRHVVNNSSNILGAAHVMTEMMMFKASLPDGKLTDPSQGAIYGRVIYPFIKVYKDTFFKAANSSVKLSDIFKGNPLKNIYRHVTDTEAATAREIAHQMSAGVGASEVKLGNRWQTRSTMAGLAVWSISAIWPDKKESDQEVERMEIMRRTNKPKYVLERFKQAVWVPGWGDHKRQMIGLGILISGVCSTFSSWRNRDKLAAVPKYIFNGGYFGTAMLSLASSMPLLFASDDQRGFGWFGTIMTGRLFFLPKSIYTKYTSKENGWQWYTAATAGFQAENWTQALIGGAEKDKSGNIIDHSPSHKAAREKAKEIRQQMRGHSDSAFTNNVETQLQTPTTTIAKVESHEPAMPERVAAHQEMVQAGA